MYEIVEISNYWNETMNINFDQITGIAVNISSVIYIAIIIFQIVVSEKIASSHSARNHKKNQPQQKSTLMKKIETLFSYLGHVDSYRLKN